MAATLGVPLLEYILINPEIARLCDWGHIEDYLADVFVPIVRQPAERMPIAR
jgi:hypothetical protein